ncbi:MAG: hypothetical protein QNK37_28910 [Acidobacteriota bacterium]|nr:hypothetical protein [Acidobacteriota bacterium]
MLRFCIAAFFFGTLLLAGESRRVPLQPLDLQKGREAFFFKSINQIESNGRHLFLRSLRETEIVEITAEGRLVRKIGGKGGHPGEFGNFGVAAMAVAGNQLWGIDSGLRRVRLFTDGIYRRSFPLRSFNVFFSHPTANVFAFSKEHVVIPAAPNDGHLATVYTWDGGLGKHVGKLLPFTEELAPVVPGINDTFWLHTDGSWLAIHKYLAVVTRFDGSFNQVGQFQVESPMINPLVRNVLEFSPDEKHNAPGPVLTDAKIHNGDLYLMSAGYLHRIDLASGAVTSITGFYGTGPEFAEADPNHVTLYFFAFLDNGQLILAHPAMMWEHDLWKADVHRPPIP